MHYSGATFLPGEEVDGQVVVDFEEAVVRNPEWKPPIQNLWGITPEDPGPGESCRGSCCAGDNVFDDAIVERLRNESYMAKLTRQVPSRREALPSLAIFPWTLGDLKSDENIIADDEYLIMADRVLGFVLHSRIWGEIPFKTN